MEAAARRPSTQKDSAAVRRWPVRPQVPRERHTDLGNQREALAREALATNDDLPFAPAQVVEFERSDLAGAKAQAREE
jgi:hypothetical protein